MPTFRALLIAALSAAMFAAPAIADVAEPNPEAAIATAPVQVDGNELFRVRGSSAFPASERAASIASRIEAAARDPKIDAAKVRIGESDDNIAIFAGNRVLMLVTKPDASIEQATPEAVAAVNAARIRQAIDEYRVGRTPERLTQGALRAGAALIAFVITAFLIVVGTRRLDRYLHRRFEHRLQTVGIQSFEIVRGERLRALVHGAFSAIRVVLILVLAVAALAYMLVQFPWTRAIGDDFAGLVLNPLQTLARGFAAQVPNLVFLVILYFVVRFVLRLIRLFFDAVARGDVALEGFDAEWALPTYKLVRIAVVAFALVVAYPYIPGSDSAAFKGVSLFAGIVFSLGSSTAIANIVAGYMMTYRRAFRVGDVVKLGDETGVVTLIRLQVTHLRTWKNEEITVPNSQILNSHVVNYSALAQKHGLVLHTIVGIGYETPWRQVEAMLIEAATRTPGLLREPPPFVRQKLLGDFAVNYELNVHCDTPEKMPGLYSALHANIQDVFNEHGVQIMTPHYEGDPDDQKLVPPGKWYLPPAVQPSQK